MDLSVLGVLSLWLTRAVGWLICYKNLVRNLMVSKSVKDFIIKTEKGVGSRWSALQGKLPATYSKQGYANASL